MKILSRVRRIRKLLPGSGGKKIYSMLKQTMPKTELQGFGRDRMYRVLRENGLLINKIRRMNGPVTDSSKTERVHENLKKHLKISQIHEVIESDMTAIRINESYKALAICMDVYSRKILGWHLCKNWSAEETVKALTEAEHERPGILNGSIHHSDRGTQYGSQVYQEICREKGITGSMSRKAKPTDAAHIERLNRTLKREFNLRRKFNSFEEANEAIYGAVIIYNEIRPHWSLGLKTPAMVYEEGIKSISPNPFRATPSMG
jgi:transposase InsO family protein